MKHDINDFFVTELKCLYNAEQQAANAMPNVIKAVESPELKNALKEHLQETNGELERLENIFSILDISPEEPEEICRPMEALIQDCNETIHNYSKSPLRDAAIITKIQRMEHFQIASYGSLRTIANDLDLDTIADFLQDSLDEEQSFDKELSKIAEGGLLTTGINQKARGQS